MPPHTSHPDAAPPAAALPLWIGPAGWSYPDWTGIVYPRRRPRGFQPLAWIARFFNAVEVNSSFYALPLAANAAQWAEVTPAGFRFAVKLTRDFTHTAELPPRPMAAAFAAGVEPLRSAGKLGPLLLQFPWSFRHTSAAVARLRVLADWFSAFERVIEVRHASWHQPAALNALQECGAQCSIDQPRLHDCLGTELFGDGPVTYVRLHGRNAANWFAADRPGWARYDYLYGDEELWEWAERLIRTPAPAGGTYVITNNHYRGQAVVNALELKVMLTGGPVDAPEELVTAYPRLGRLRTTDQGRLFE